VEGVARQGGTADRGTLASIGIVVSALAALTLAVLASAPLELVVPPLALVVVLALTWRALTPWPRLLAGMILVILFIPIRRYALPFDAGIQLEPYRLLVAAIVAGWAVALLVDPRVRLRRSGFEGPLALLVATALASEAANFERFASVQTIAVKQLSFLLSFIVVLYLVVSVIRHAEQVDLLLRVLVGGGAGVALLTIFEARTQYNVFDHLSEFVPLLRFDEPPAVGNDGRGYRAYASGQHPISLGAALVMLVPLGLYLIRSTGRRRWWAASGVLLLGALVTGSRTAVLVLFVILLVYAFQRPHEVKRLWPAAAPLVVALYFAAPGTMGTIKNSFFPEGGLIASQSQDAGTAGSGRIADLGPGIEEWKRTPFVGQGFGTRVVDGPEANAPILDDQWLTTLLESGAFGMFAWLWLFVRAHRRFTRAARADDSMRGWLFTALAASVTSYAVSMATYDSFSFIQVSFLLFLLLAFGAALLRVSESERLSGRAPAAP
jgi:O-antigen ligase